MKINNHTVEYLARGEFARVYRSTDDPTVVFVLTANDTYKEIYSHVESPHVPYMSSLGEIYINGKWYNVFESRYYNKLTKEYTAAWSQAKALRALWDQVFYDYDNYYKKFDPNRRYELMYDFIDLCREDDRIPESIIDALDNLYTWATAYGSNFLCEFPKRNLKVNDNGDLILLDIIYYR